MTVNTDETTNTKKEGRKGVVVAAVAVVASDNYAYMHHTSLSSGENSVRVRGPCMVHPGVSPVGGRSNACLEGPVQREGFLGPSHCTLQIQ